MLIAMSIQMLNNITNQRKASVIELRVLDKIEACVKKFMIDVNMLHGSCK